MRNLFEAAPATDERLGLLLLPIRLEQFELAEHARGLLRIPRVVALEPGRVRTPNFLRNAAPMRQAKRLKFPGVPRLVVLYHPMQYPLARALATRYERAETWYLRPERSRLDDEAGYMREELLELDGLAAERAARTFDGRRDSDLAAATDSLRERMVELEIISHKPFVPGARFGRR